MKAVSVTMKKLNMMQPAWQRCTELNSGLNKRSRNKDVLTKTQEDCKDSTSGGDMGQIHDNEYVVVEIGI